MYPLCTCRRVSPLTHIPSIPTVWGGLGRVCPYMPLWLFLLSGGEFWHAPSFQSMGQRSRGLPQKSLLYLPIVLFTQCSCPFGLEGSLGNRVLCAPVASRPLGFSYAPRWVSCADLAPPQASCPCRSYAWVPGCQLSGLRTESREQGMFIWLGLYEILKPNLNDFRINHFSIFFFIFKNKEEVFFIFAIVWNLFYFYFLKNVYWRVVDLQCCVSFRCTESESVIHMGRRFLFIYLFTGHATRLAGSSLTRDWTRGHGNESTSPNHWTSREFPNHFSYNKCLILSFD